MYLYAVLNENGVCVGLSSLAGEVLRADHIPIETMDEDLLYRKFEEGEWSKEKFVPDHAAIELSRMEKLEKENIDLKLALAELAENAE